MGVKKITLSVDEAILRAARAYAAEHDTTVSVLVRKFLAELIREEEGAEVARAKARQGLFTLSERSTGRLGPDWKWNREDIYRERLSRLEKRSRPPGEKGSAK